MLLNFDCKMNASITLLRQHFRAAKRHGGVIAHGPGSVGRWAAYALITAFDSQLPSIYRKKCPFRNFNGPSFFSFFCCSSVAPMNEIYRRSCCNDVCENALDDGATAAAEAKNIGARGILVSHLTVLTI